MPFQGIQLSLPSADLFKFPPSPEPHALPPPAPGSTLSAPPFSIPSAWFNSVLDARVPITIASIYAVSVTLVNAYNRSRGNKAWPVSKTKTFFWFVVAHNIFLAVYSAWTFVGMFGALRRSVASPSASSNGLAATVDSLCKMHGTSGLGNAIAYDGGRSSWVSQTPENVLLSAAGTPEATDLGRLWNEGLAFYGWFFYLSKFYEVLDTVIIVAKGKRSSTLQTYHHAGAMMCMWAGIRYMSPPIWMFVLVNSFIHTLMYTYYTLTAFEVPIPQALKRSLTTMQIIQFLVGVVYASLHSFVSYTIPTQVPTIKSVASAVSSTAVAAATTAGLTDLIKKYLFRAAGEEGLAENLGGVHHNHTSTSYTEDGIKYHTEYKSIPCVDTNGQTLAIWINIFYLTPLTFLFMRFFVKSYITRTIGKAAAEKKRAAEKAAVDALKGADRELNGGLKEGANGATTNGHANGHANGNAVNGLATRTTRKA